MGDGLGVKMNGVKMSIKMKRPGTRIKKAGAKKGGAKKGGKKGGAKKRGKKGGR